MPLADSLGPFSPLGRLWRLPSSCGFKRSGGFLLLEGCVCVAWVFPSRLRLSTRLGCDSRGWGARLGGLLWQRRFLYIFLVAKAIVCRARDGAGAGRGGWLLAWCRRAGGRWMERQGSRWGGTGDGARGPPSPSRKDGLGRKSACLSRRGRIWGRWEWGAPKPRASPGA